jgi:autotransporter translocation and assembly factor TamB
VKAAVSGVSVGLLLPGQDVSGVLSGNIDVTGSMLRPIGEVDLRVPKLTVFGGQFDSVAVLAQLSQTQAILRSLSAQLDTGKLSSLATLRHEKGRPLELSVELAKLPIGKLPIVQGLPLVVDGTLSGALKMIGSTQPLLPVFDGKLSVDGFTVQGRVPTALGPAVEGGVVLAEREPLFGLLGMVVRVLTLGQAELRFTPVGAGTKITGRLFESFEVDGVLTLAGGLPRGDLTIRFGCPLPPYFAKSADGPTSVRVSSTVLACDLLAQKLLPDWRSLAMSRRRGAGSCGCALATIHDRCLDPIRSLRAALPVRRWLPVRWRWTSPGCLGRRCGSIGRSSRSEPSPTREKISAIWRSTTGMSFRASTVVTWSWARLALSVSVAVVSARRRSRRRSWPQAGWRVNQ